ncbi:DUF4276 family protein [Bradyrhizobium sp. ERR14]|uniref:DUF4276 family protein n=1 Tax=Bradyrhizobium sp. ERR14 TaxID=2663837 RepID=UPI001618907F|nr:DUF4276 family protein [Bradyrhizobium sp. ERR14]MBB4394563.1 hypothetical protein [Bradyrhizobium sp. ERR14]
MKRLLVHVEGQTEETFVNEVLYSHLSTHGYANVGARLIGNARLRVNRGGTKPWESVKREIVSHLKNDGACISTLMVDFYALPASAPGGWPGRAEANALGSVAEKAAIVQKSLLTEVKNEMGGGFDQSRFVPFVLMHEFEALLFSDCPKFAEGIGQTSLAPEFQLIRDAFVSPEEINDSPQTAPSKRIAKLFPQYEKILHGNLAILRIGLQTIKDECSNFRVWLETLEQLGAAA